MPRSTPRPERGPSTARSCRRHARHVRRSSTGRSPRSRKRCLGCPAAGHYLLCHISGAGSSPGNRMCLIDRRAARTVVGLAHRLPSPRNSVTSKRSNNTGRSEQPWREPVDSSPTPRRSASRPKSWSSQGRSPPTSRHARCAWEGGGGTVDPTKSNDLDDQDEPFTQSATSQTLTEARRRKRPNGMASPTAAPPSEIAAA